MSLNHKQIGEVAELLGLSLRTIRYYEEVGLLSPSTRSPGGFRLYSDTDIARLQVIKRMKPLDFSLEEMRDLLTALDRLGSSDIPPEERESLLERLVMFRLAAEERCENLRAQLDVAEGFAASLREEIARQGSPVAGQGVAGGRGGSGSPL